MFSSREDNETKLTDKQRKQTIMKKLTLAIITIIILVIVAKIDRTPDYTKNVAINNRYVSQYVEACDLRYSNGISSKICQKNEITEASYSNIMASSMMYITSNNTVVSEIVELHANGTQIETTRTCDSNGCTAIINITR